MELNYHRQGTGETLVLIHGIGHRWQGWAPVLDLLSAERDVVAIDLPGFGASPPPPAGTPPGIASLTKLVAAFLDRLGLQRPHVAGNSLGGWVGLELGKAGRAASVTGLSPAGFHTLVEGRFQYASLWATVRVARLGARYADRLTGPPLARKLAFAQLAAHPERIEPVDAAETLRALAAAPWFDQTLKAITQPGGFTGDVDVPVTIAWGEHDRLLLPRQLATAGRALPAAKLITLPGCGHVPMFDNPELVARVLLEGSPLRTAAVADGVERAPE